MKVSEMERLEFLQWLLGHGKVSDWPGEVDRLFISQVAAPTRGLEVLDRDLHPAHG